MDIIKALFEVREKKQARLLKYCDPAMKQLQTQFGKDGLKEKAIKAFIRNDEESK